ncbi:MAG: HEAT repeat domain-containing protein, partial [Anaerolineae bacterium]
MLLSELLQRQERWSFDLRSALIGAMLAWIVAGIIYRQREQIAELAQRIWEPIAAWRRRVRASQEVKYARALREALQRLLLLKPEDPTLIFRPPTFLAPAPLPTSVAEVARSPRQVAVDHASLLAGHNRLVITGAQGSGRTTALVMSAWEATASLSDEPQEGQTRLPVWIDLSRFPSDVGKTDPPAPERLVSLAAAFLPAVSPKWLLQHLRRDPCWVLIDNWHDLAPDQRHHLARWIAEAAEDFPDTYWTVASGETGYGELVELGFVPLELLPVKVQDDLPDIYEAWRQLVGTDRPTEPASAPKTAQAEGPLTTSSPGDAMEDVVEFLRRAADAGAPVWELHIRTALHLQTGELPERPVEVLGRYIEQDLARVELGRSAEDVAEQAREVVLETLIDVAKAQRLDGRRPTGQELRALIEANSPPKEERPRRLDGAVRRLVTGQSLLRHENRAWQLTHAIWSDYLTAIHLAEEGESGQEMVRAHLNDPAWFVLTEFYAGMTNPEPLVQSLVNQAETYDDIDTLLRAVRWAAVGKSDQVWRKELTKVLARNFMSADVAYSDRLSLGHALGLVAGTGARAFFLRMLRHPTAEVRQAALRGLGWIGSHRDMAVLGAALREKDAGVCESAVLALRDLGTPGATTLLSEKLPQADEAVMLVIAEALAQTPGGPDALRDATRHPDLLVRRAAAHGLGQIPESWATEELLEIAREDPEWFVRSAADTALQAQEERAELQTRV